MPGEIRDKWVPVTTALPVLNLRMEERHPMWRLAANILNKLSRTADNGWSSSLGDGRDTNISSPYKVSRYEMFTRVSNLHWYSTGGGHLWMRQWNFGFHKVRGISWLAENRLASQEGLCFIEQVSKSSLNTNSNTQETVLSPSSILPPPSSNCVFIPAKKNSASVSKALLFQILWGGGFKNFEKSEFA